MNLRMLALRYLGFSINMEKNIAVVGCGYWGKNLVRNFYELGVLKSICDPDKDLISKMTSLYDVEPKNFLEILEDDEIQGVVIASPAFLHADLAIRALEKKKNVFVEKPLAINENEALQIINCAKKNDKQLMVGHLLQYHPVFKRIKEIVKSKELGELIHISSSRKSMGKIRSEEDVLWSFAPHDISMILSLADRNISKIDSDRIHLLQKDIADISRILIEFEGGLKADVSVSWIHPHKEQKLIVTLEQGILIFDDTLDWSKKLELVKYHHVNKKDEHMLYKDDSVYIGVKMQEPLRQECEHFIECIKLQEKPLTDGVEGLEVLKVLSGSI
tara:strand:+ start:7707 stop:8699 length:993 start_codon:yes stop_codon:yes gene_type:complete